MYNSPFPFTISVLYVPAVATTCDSIPKHLQLCIYSCTKSEAKKRHQISWQLKGEETCTYIATSTGGGRVPPHTQQAFQEVQHLFPTAIAPREKRQACTRREVLKHGVRLTRVVSYCLCHGLGLARHDPAGSPKHGRAGFQSCQVHGSQSPTQNLLQDRRRQGFNTARHC
jgi:hypothetical protein